MQDLEGMSDHQLEQTIATAQDVLRRRKEERRDLERQAVGESAT